MTQAVQPLVSVRNLVKHFPIKKGIFSRTVGHVKAVDNVSFDIFPHETLGVVGESGCGKTTAGRTLLRLIEPSSGEAFFKGQDLFKLGGAELRKARRNMQIIFQDPYSSLNPRMTVDSIIGEAMEIHGIAKGEERRERVKELLLRVGLQPSYINRYPHEFSGGQRQRIGIARALALEPRFIVCDEPTSALDVSIQAQIINLLTDLQKEFGLSYLFISHDMSVIQHVCKRIAVMYKGKVVEAGERDQILFNAQHKYTQSLLSAVPTPDPMRKKSRIAFEGGAM
jgi:ABC-type oligopeptide transport system ATPase subunit